MKKKENRNMDGMPNDLAPKIEIDKAVMGRIRKIQNDTFLLYSYSKRHFNKKLFDISGKSPLESFSDPYSFMLLSINDFIKTYENAILRIRYRDGGRKEPSIEELMKCMCALLMVYHNEKHPEFENIFFDIRIIKSIDEYKQFLCHLTHLNEKEKAAISLLHELTYDYGFYVWELLIPDSLSGVILNIGKYLKDCVNNEESISLPAVNTFLKRQIISKKKYLKIEYIDQNKPFIIKDNLKDELLIGIDPTDQKVSLIKIKHKLDLHIDGIKNKKRSRSRRRRKRNIQSKEDLKNAKIIFHIDLKSNLISKKYILDAIKYSIDGYRSFFMESGLSQLTPCRVLGLNEDDQSINVGKEIKEHNLKTERNLKRYEKTIEFPYERRELASRLIGIWLWDRIHLNPNPMTQAEAIREILKMRLPPSFDISINKDKVNKDSIKRMLRKEYELACRCIEKRKLLHLSEPKKK